MVSLRRALELLPDDRATQAAVREVVAFFGAHPKQPIEPHRVARATGLDPDRIAPVLEALSRAFVLDCDGDPMSVPGTYDPDAILALEVGRYLRVKDSTPSRLRTSVDRFRGRSGLL